MKDYFDKHQLPRDINIVKNKEKMWNSFSRAPLEGESVHEHEYTIGELDSNIESFDIKL